MAQSPETKALIDPNEPNEQTTRDDSMRKAVRQSMAAEQSFGRAGATLVKPSGEPVSQATEAAKASAEAVKTTAEATSEATQKGMRQLAEGQRALIEAAAGRFETLSRRMAAAAAEMTEDLRSFMLVPPAPVTDLRHLQDGMSGLMRGVVQTNLKMAQELMRVGDPLALFELQQRMGREYLGALMQGTGAFIRVARQATEQTLRPMEERIEQGCRRMNGGEQQRAAAAE
jgi:hypothetical protein